MKANDAIVSKHTIDLPSSQIQITNCTNMHYTRGKAATNNSFIKHVQSKLKFVLMMQTD